jgi:hypothetical protein
MKVDDVRAPTRTPSLRAGKLGAFSGLAAIACCIYPVVLVLFGLASASEAIALGNRLYGIWGWVFKLAGAAFAVIGVIVQLRRRGQCNVQGVRRNRAYMLRVLLIALGVYWVVYGVTRALAAWGS